MKEKEILYSADAFDFLLAEHQAFEKETRAKISKVLSDDEGQSQPALAVREWEGKVQNEAENESQARQKQGLLSSKIEELFQEA